MKRNEFKRSNEGQWKAQNIFNEGKITHIVEHAFFGKPHLFNLTFENDQIFEQAFKLALKNADIAEQTSKLV